MDDKRNYGVAISSAKLLNFLNKIIQITHLRLKLPSDKIDTQLTGLFLFQSIIITIIIIIIINNDNNNNNNNNNHNNINNNIDNNKINY